MPELKNKVKELKNITWSEIKKLNFNQLKNNSNRDVKKLKKSITERGFFSPFMIWNDYIFDGSGRVLALKELEKEGLEIPDLPCLLVEASNLAEAKIYALQMSSKHGEITQESLYEFTWDIPEVETLIDEVDFYEFNMEFGEVEELEPEPEAKEDDFDTTPPEQAKTVLGDLYEIGEHRLLCGDSTDSDTVAKLMNGEKADMVFTDPPYGVGYEGINNDDRGGLEELLRGAFGNMMLSTNNGGSFYCFHSDKCSDIFSKVYREFCHFSSMIIWVKESIVLSQTDYQSKHEPCIYGWFDNGTHKWYSDRKQESVWIAKSKREEGHTTPKPIEIITKALNNSSKVNHLMLDLFLGSGSTMVASHQLKRKCYGMELDPKYCDVIIKRMIKLDSKLTVKRNGVDVSKEFKN